MAQSSAVRSKLYKMRHPERFTAEARREYRQHNEKAYRSTDKYKQSQKRYRTTLKYKNTNQDYHLLHKYGINVAEKQRMYIEQNGLCGLCNRALPENLSKCHTDHNHTTGKLRQLLHHRCNVLVGFFEKDPELPPKVIGYLEKHNG